MGRQCSRRPAGRTGSSCRSHEGIGLRCGYHPDPAVSILRGRDDNRIVAQFLHGFCRKTLFFLQGVVNIVSPCTPILLICLRCCNLLFWQSMSSIEDLCIGIKVSRIDFTVSLCELCCCSLVCSQVDTTSKLFCR